MSAFDYLLNGILVALIFLQIRGRRMSVRMLALPVVIVAVVAAKYLHGIPTAGNDGVLVAAGALAGLVLGAGCGLATSVTRVGPGRVVAKAGVLAVVLWIAGVGARLAFALYAQHGGQDAIGRFSVAHHITSGEAWVAALVLMALLEVVSRNAVLAVRFVRQPQGDALEPASAAATEGGARPAGRAMMDIGGRSS